MCDATGAKNQRELAEMLGVSSQAITNVRKKARVPDAWLVILMERGINPQFLLTGTGAMRLADAPPAPRAPAHPEDRAGKRFVTVVATPDGEQRVASDHPAAGIVTNASGLALPIGHFVEHSLCPQVRTRLDEDGAPVATGGGVALPRDMVRRIVPEPSGLRSLETSDGTLLFDVGQTDPEPGRIYVLDMGGVLFARRCAVSPAGMMFLPLCGADGPDEPLPAAPGGDGQAPRVMGRVVWIGREV